MAHDKRPLIKCFFCFVTFLGETSAPENKITEQRWKGESSDCRLPVQEALPCQVQICRNWATIHSGSNVMFYSSRNKKFNFRFGEIYCTCIKHPYKKSLRLLFSTLRKTFQVFENRTHSPKHAKLQNFLADPCLQFNRKCSWVNPSNYQRKVSFTFKFLFPLGFYKTEKTRFFSKFLQKLSKN